MSSHILNTPFLVDDQFLFNSVDRSSDLLRLDTAATLQPAAATLQPTAATLQPAAATLQPAAAANLQWTDLQHANLQ